MARSVDAIRVTVCKCRTRCHVVRDADGQLWLHMAHPKTGEPTGARHHCIRAGESFENGYGHVFVEAGDDVLTFHPARNTEFRSSLPAGYVDDAARCLGCAGPERSGGS